MARRSWAGADPSRATGGEPNASRVHQTCPSSRIMRLPPAAGIAVVMITLKRAYEPASPADGRRVLVERLWPRGIAKADLGVDEWLKEVAPSTQLRKWFRHDPHKWNEFRRRYFRELDSRPNAWKSILSAARRAKITLIYSAHDTQHNNAVALRDFLHAQPRRPRAAKKNATAVRRSRQTRPHR
jgi:uncharacterized protein YeaO (DUF488 family)